MNFVAKLLAWLFILFPVAFLLFIVFHYSETLFFADDFHLLKTIVWMQDANNFSQKLGLLVQQHNEHRILFPRLLTWLDYQLEGYIDWPVLMLFGNVLWCAVLYFLWDAFRTLKLGIGYFIPVPWLLFQPTYYDNYTWSISVLQQSVIVFLLAWLVHAFVNRRYLLAIIIFLIATFTHGNGIFGIVVGVVFLFLYRDWKWLGIWLAVCGITAATYFYGFGRGQNADFLQSLSQPVQMIGYFFAFFGSTTQLLALGFGPTVLWGMIAFGGICWFGFSEIYNYYRAHAPLSYFDKMLLGNLLFLSVTALLVAVARSWSSPDLDIPSRYAHYSPYLTAWFYLVTLAVLSRRAGRGRVVPYWAAVWSVAAVALNAASYLNRFSDLEYRRDWLRADGANWNNYSTFLQYVPSFNRNIHQVYTEAIARGICRQDATPPPVSASHTLTDSSILLTFEEASISTQDASRKYNDKVLRVQDGNYWGETPLLLLIAEDSPPLWVPFYRGRNGYRKMLSERRLRKPELIAEVLTDNLPVGVFRLGYRSGDTLTLTKYRLEVDSDHVVKAL